MRRWQACRPPRIGPTSQGQAFTRGCVSLTGELTDAVMTAHEVDISLVATNEELPVVEWLLYEERALTACWVRFVRFQRAVV